MATKKSVKIKNVFFTIKYIASFAYTVNPKMFVGLMIVNVLWGISSVPIFFIERETIDTLVRSIGSEEVASALYYVGFLVGLTIILQFLRSVLSRINGLLRNMLSRLLDMEMIAQIGAKQAELDLATIEDPDFKDKFDRIEKEVSRRSWGLMLSISDIPNYLTGFISGVVVISLIHPLVSIGLVILSIPKVLADIRFIREEYELNKNIAPKRRTWGWLNSYLMKNNNYMELKILGLADHIKSRMSEISGQIITLYSGIQTNRLKSNTYTQIPLIVYELCLSIFLVFQVIVTKITLGTFQLYVRSLNLAQNNFAALMSALTEIYDSYQYISDLMWLMEQKPDIESESENDVHIEKVDSIVFKDVYFRYRKDTPSILKGINFSIKSGEKIAIVGENGAGKTTLIKLLGAFYRPTKGSVVVSGVDLVDVHSSSWKKKLAILFQEFESYPFTVRESIGFGDLENIDDNEEIISSAKRAGIHSFINKLPLKYKNPLTPYFDKGIRPSVGQMQRIGIARMLFRKKAEVLILDEPTSNVDPEAEEKIFRELKRITKDKILIFVTQRFSTVKIADRIFVVNNGKIVEQGTHKELMKLDGKYAHLFNLQAQAYLEN